MFARGNCPPERPRDALGEAGMKSSPLRPHLGAVGLLGSAWRGGLGVSGRGDCGGSGRVIVGASRKVIEGYLEGCDYGGIWKGVFMWVSGKR